MRVNIVHSQCTPPEDGSPWLYFGRDIHRYHQLKAALPAGRALSAGALVNRVAGQIRDAIVNFDQVFDFDTTALHWQTTDLAEKNPLISDFYYNSCALIGFDRLLSTVDANLTVFVESRALGLALVEQAQARGFKVRSRLFCGVLGRMPYTVLRRWVQGWYVLKGVYTRLRFIWQTWNDHRIARTRLDPNSAAEVDTLLVTWPTPDTFTSAHPLDRETYYGELPGFLRAQGAHVGYLAHATWLYPFKELAETLAGAADPVITLPQGARPVDAFRDAVASFFWRWPVARRLVVEEVDLTGLLHYEMWVEKSKARQAIAMQYYHMARTLSEKVPNLRRIVHTYENQPWEKALRLGIKRFCPEVEIIGYMHMPFAPTYLSFLPSTRDLQCTQHPDCIVTTGPAWCRVLREHGYTAETLRAGPALRFAPVLARQESPASARALIDKKVVVAGSIDYHETFGLIVKAVSALRDVSDVRVRVKLHPKMAQAQALLDGVLAHLALKELPAHIAVVDTPIPELLPGARALLFNSTAVVFEALALGVPALFVQSDIRLDINKLARYPDLVIQGRTPDEIRAGVLALLKEDPETTARRRTHAHALIESSFAPPDAETMGVFLDG